jgi:hypothetical protein
VHPLQVAGQALGLALPHPVGLGLEDGPGGGLDLEHLVVGADDQVVGCRQDQLVKQEQSVGGLHGDAVLVTPPLGHRRLEVSSVATG